MSTSATQYGMTWTWVEDLTVGQYANGDYYVVAPAGLTMTAITPASTDTAGRIKNGSMANPTAGLSASNGFDNLADGTYSAALNIARPGGSDISVGNPKAISAGTSIVSCISRAVLYRPQLTDAAILTVVAAAPAANSFRPPYCGTDKTHNWNVSDLDYTVLKSYPAVSSTPTIASQVAVFDRPWIEIDTQWMGRDLHPSNNQPDYGREISNSTSAAKLRLDLEDSDVLKEPLAIVLCQYGIDIYGAAVSGAVWNENGGHNMGRKLPLLLAAKMFGDANMLAYCDAAQHNIFQEDQQTCYVDANDVTITTVGTNKPIASMLVTGGYLVVTTTAAHGMAARRVVELAGVTPSAYDGIWHTISVTSNTVNLRKISSVGTTDSGAASVVGTMEYFSTWTPDNRASATQYQSGDIGTSEWGIRATLAPTQNNFNSEATYRGINDGPGLGAALGAILLTGGEAAWNYPVFFEYTDRYYAIRGSSYSLYLPFQRNMWVAYRNGAPAAPTLVSSEVATGGLTLTLIFSVSCTNGANGGNGITVTASGGVSTATYDSGSGSTTYVYNLSRKILSGETVSIAYVQPTNGIEATVGTVDVLSFSDQACTNSSTQVATAYPVPAKRRLTGQT